MSEHEPPALLDLATATRGGPIARLVVIRCTAPGCSFYNTTELVTDDQPDLWHTLWRHLGWRQTDTGARCRDHAPRRKR